MRALGAGVGLLSLLIAVALMTWLWSEHTTAVVQQAKPAEEQVRQFAGRTEDGRPAIDTVTLEPLEKNGTLKAMVVTAIEAGGEMEKYFGLKVGDQVTAAGPLDFDGSARDARAFIADAYQRKSELTVLRNGQKIKLPQQ